MHYSFLVGPEAQKVSKWVAHRIAGCERGWTQCAALVVIKDEQIIGGVIFHDYSPETGVICLSAAGEGPWLTRATIRMTHEYIFEHCQMAVWECDEENDAINRVAKGLGYTPHRIPRLGGRDKARILWTLTDDQWSQSKYKR